jgi:hypothetical protein
MAVDWLRGIKMRNYSEQAQAGSKSKTLATGIALIVVAVAVSAACRGGKPTTKPPAVEAAEAENSSKSQRHQINRDSNPWGLSATGPESVTIVQTLDFSGGGSSMVGFPAKVTVKVKDTNEILRASELVAGPQPNRIGEFEVTFRETYWCAWPTLPYGGRTGGETTTLTERVR